VEQSLVSSLGKCPSCGHLYTALNRGSQPTGDMRVTLQPHSHCSGFEGCGLFAIIYQFGSGSRQSRFMPEPGKRYSGASRSAYLPNTAEGRKAVGLLKRAFAAGHVFQVGESGTTGQRNTTVWYVPVHVERQREKE
jgi:deltex-like protein